MTPRLRFVLVAGFALVMFLASPASGQNPLPPLGGAAAAALGGAAGAAPASTSAAAASTTPSSPPVFSSLPTLQIPSQFSIDLSQGDQRSRVAMVLKILALFTVLALAPSILVMMTSFTRIVVVLSFVRRALALQEVPPTQVIIGLALFLTFFTMAPTWNRVYEDSLRPYFAGALTEVEAYSKAEAPIRDFMFRNTRKPELAMFIAVSKIPRPQVRGDVPTYVLIPSFLLSEIKTSFIIGFLIFIPFLVIDMVVASVLLSMGMMMLPPVIVSLPFKIILFVLVDGWTLIVGSLVQSYT